MATPMEASAQADYDAALAADLSVNTQLSTWEMLWRTAQRVPDNDAFITGDTHISYRDLASQSLRAAASLAEMGVGHGTRVAFLFHPNPDWAVLHYALARLGAVGVPINTSYMAAELEHLFTLARPDLLITVDRFRDVDMAARLSPVAAEFGSIAETVVLPLGDDGWVAPSAERDRVYGPDGGVELEPSSRVGGDDPAYIIFTSGSTAAPKPALIAHRGMVGAATGLQHALGLAPEDRFVASNPVFHTGGIVWNLTMPHLVGMTSCLVGVYETGKVLREMERSKITVMGAFDTKADHDAQRSRVPHGGPQLGDQVQRGGHRQLSAQRACPTGTGRRWLRCTAPQSRAGWGRSLPGARPIPRCAMTPTAGPCRAWSS